MTVRHISSLLLFLFVACGDDDGAPVDTMPQDSAADVQVNITEPVLPEVVGECPSFVDGETIMVNGLAVEVIAGEPQSEAGPILVAFHGTGGSGARYIATLSNAAADIRARGGLLLAPTSDGSTREGASPNGVWFEGSDLELMDQLVACGVRDHNIDPEQIFVTGCSAGGLMAGALAAYRNQYVAGAFLDSGGIVAGNIRSMPAPSVIAMHGGEGDNVIINFGVTSRSLLQGIDYFGGSAIECNHTIGHCLPPAELTEGAWRTIREVRFGEPITDLSMLPNYCEFFVADDD